MCRSNILILCCFLLLGGCVNKQILKSQVADIIKENPQMVLEALDDNSVQLLEIVERGVDKREKQKNKARFEKELKNPFKPQIDVSRIILGNPNAPVTVVEYSDFLCPYCGQANKMINNMVKNHPEKYRLFYKHFPLHKGSRKIAQVYEAIASFDHDKALDFKDYVFSHQKQFAGNKLDIALSEAVTKVKVDMGLFKEALNSEKITKIIADDLEEADTFRLDATPTFMVNGVTIRGYVSAKKFDDITNIILNRENASETDNEGEVCEDCLNQL